MTELPPVNDQPAAPSAHVRFTESEYARVHQDAELRGLSIPRLLKETYFRGAPGIILMGREEARAILVQMARLGNNLNQAMRAFHSGGGSGALLQPILELMRLMGEVRGKIERGTKHDRAGDKQARAVRQIRDEVREEREQLPSGGLPRRHPPLDSLIDDTP